VNPKEYSIPDELILSIKTNQGPLEVSYSEIEDEKSVSIRDYIRFGQIFGQFDDIKVWSARSDDEIMERVGRYLSFPALESELCLNLIQTNSREDIRNFLRKFSYGSATASSSLFKEVPEWRPSFIPGKGTVVRFSECLKITLRATLESWEIASSLFSQYWIELAYILDQTGISKEELFPVAEEVYWEFHTSFGHGQELDALSTGPEDFHTASEGRSSEQTFVTAPAETEEEALVSYLEYQVRGRARQLDDLMAHHMRIEARMTNLDHLFGASETIFDDLSDSEQALGGMFEESDNDHG
jgi:hypothetical protein